MTPAHSKARVALASLAVIAACLLVGIAYMTAASRTADAVYAAAERQLQILALDLESLLERYETVPFSLGFHPEVAAVLQDPENVVAINELNVTLEAIQRQAKVDAIYVMDRNGLTLAASNWNQPVTFIGRNFAYRPYFYHALAGEPGHFYGIGSATNEPGYFIAQPVYANPTDRSARPIGVITVKVGLAAFEQAWRGSEEAIALADRNGVVFLSNREEWRYRSLIPLGESTQTQLASTLQYGSRKIPAIASLPQFARLDFGGHVSKRFGRLEWQLMLFPSTADIRRAGMFAALAATLVIGLAILSLLAYHQRRRRMEERRLSRQAMQRAAEDLDRTIAFRTAELLSANHDLEVKYAKLQETEKLLRTTQNELVQAGKLAMLGQMAAGMTHELNQPLTAIRTFADNAAIFIARGQADKAGENLQHISDASARMGAIIGQLKGFARKSHATVSHVDLRHAIDGSIMLLASEFRRQDAEIVTNADLAGETIVVGDIVRTEQVLINLLRNAIDAVSGTAVRRIEISLQREGEDAGEAVIRIRDSGPGIPAEAAPHLFEPFFTTKPPGEGLGLGLAISSSIVQAMNGRLDAGNRPEGGAEFTLRLPLCFPITHHEGSKLVDA